MHAERTLAYCIEYDTMGSCVTSVSEMRIDIGPGYRLYFTIRDEVVVFLLTGGSKSTQSADIRRAVKMAREI